VLVIEILVLSDLDLVSVLKGFFDKRSKFLWS
jgi:hypothetical protein